MASTDTNARPRIAVFSGPTATIQNTEPLVTSNKAREKYGLTARSHGDGSAMRFDVLRAQRLAAPVTVYVEQFSAHPLERDGPSDVNVRRRHVDPELDAERTPLAKLLLETAVGQEVHGVPCEALEDVRAHGEPIVPTSGSASGSSTPRRTCARTCRSAPGRHACGSSRTRATSSA